MKLPIISVVVALISGCANTGVVQVAPDTFLLAKQDNAGIFGNAQRFKAEVIQEANDFAQAKGKVAIPVSLDETPARPGRFATVQYQFRLLEPSDPEAKRVVTLTKRADVVVESSSKSKIDLKVQPSSGQARDTYSELLKLDDLRKRGILSEAEFEAEKKKLLEALK